MLIIGHRGNGLERQELVDMLELDLRKSGHDIVVHHDRLGKKRGQKLVELLPNIRVPLNLELKESGFETELLQMLKNFSSEVVISSKHPWYLKKIRALDEKVKIGLILGSANFFLLPWIKSQDKKLNLYSIHPESFFVNSSMVKRLKKLGKPIYVWTVNRPKRFAQLEKLNVDGVFTDKPELIRKHD